MASILYVATAKGIFTVKSNDGRRWEIGHQSLEDWTVPKIAVSPFRPNTVFAGTRGDGVWVSEDFGESWTKPCYGKRGPGKVRCVAVDARDPDTVYAGTEPIDVFVSRDAAGNWSRIDSLWEMPSLRSVVYPVPAVEPHVRDIAIDPGDPDTMYAALQVGFMVKTTDAGKTWKLLSHGLDADVHSIVVDPQNPRSLFAATGGHQYRSGVASGRALYRSEDGGESWIPTAMGFPHDYAVPLVMHPEDSSILFAALAKGHPGMWRDRPMKAESVIIRTNDGGRSWQPLDGNVPEVSRDFAEALAIDRSNPNRVYGALKSGFLYASEDGGDTWASLDIQVAPVSDMKCVNA